MKSIDAAIGAVAAQQHGIVAADELVGIGVSLEQIHKRVLSGRLIVLHDGVYRVAGAPEIWQGKLLAAVKAGGPGTYASHHSFARLFGLRGTYDTRPEVTIVGTRLPLLAGVRVHRIDRLVRVDTAVRDGIPSLAPPLGLLLLGGRMREVALHNAVHDAIYQRLTTRVKLEEIHRAYGGRGRPGSGKLRRAIKSLPASGRGSQTGLELELYRLLVDADMGEPELQHEIIDGNGDRRVFDIAYTCEKVDLEADGSRDHTSPGARADDERRDAAVRAIGWEPIRYTADEIRNEPDRIIREVRTLLASRSSSVSVPLRHRNRRSSISGGGTRGSSG